MLFGAELFEIQKRAGPDVRSVKPTVSNWLGYWHVATGQHSHTVSPIAEVRERYDALLAYS